jgi:hypothetical protein
MKRKPASQPEGLKNPTARVLIAEVAPDADHIIQQLKKEPALLSRTVRQLIKHSARLIEVAPLIQKGKKRAETEAKTLGRHNQEKNARRQLIIKSTERLPRGSLRITHDCGGPRRTLWRRGSGKNC